MTAKLLLVSLASAAAMSDRGILTLDNTTFKKIVSGFTSVIVRFDKEYSYGDEHNAWKDFGAAVGDSGADLIVANVGVSEYGEKDNSDLAEQFGIAVDSFPQFRLWKKGKSMRDAPVAYTGTPTKDDFLRFVTTEAGVWVGLPGQIKELDEIAKKIASGGNAAGLVTEAEAAAAKATGEELAKYYVKVIKKVSEDSAFVTKEVTRLKKMVDTKSVTADKKLLFGRRLNVLSSFS